MANALHISGKSYEVLKLIDDAGNSQRYLARCRECAGSLVMLTRYALSSDEAIQEFGDLRYLWSVLRRAAHIATDSALDVRYCKACDCMLGYRVMPIYRPALRHGCNVDDVMTCSNGGNSVVRCFAIIRSVAAALMTLHALSPPLTHGRLSTDCVVSDDAGRVRLGNVEHATCFFYTPRNEAEVTVTRKELIDQRQPRSFLAPELRSVAIGRRVDNKVDMWSMGILILHVFGRLLGDIVRSDTLGDGYSVFTHDAPLLPSSSLPHAIEEEVSVRRKVDAMMHLVHTCLLVIDPVQRMTIFAFALQLNDIMSPMRGLRLPNMEIVSQQQQQRPRFTH